MRENIPADPHISQCAPAAADCTRLAAVLADGFADDTVMNWALGSAKPQRLMFYLLARHIYLHRGGGVLWTEDGADKAACLWLKPDQSKDLALVPTFRLSASVAVHGGVSAVLRTLKLDAMLETKHPVQPHVYLFAVAVHPDFQGQGLGRRVLAPMLDYSDANALPVYLENSKARNLPFYHGLGFEVVEQLDLHDGALPLWLMQRRPA